MPDYLTRSIKLSAALLLTSAALAQPIPIAPDMELRVAACTTCHGREGRATNSGYFPRLAGKPAGYLFGQLQNFRDGRRQQTHMSVLLANMPDSYLREMAEYFASLDFPYLQPGPRPANIPSEQLARGKSLVFHGDPARAIPACVSCHGTALTGVQPGIPSLLGLPRVYVAAQLGSWVTDQRRAMAPDCMAEVGRKLTSDDIQAIVGWLDAQPIPLDMKPAASLRDELPLPCSTMGAQQ